MHRLTNRPLMPKKETSLIVFLTPAIGWGILICYFSLMPSQEVPSMLKSMQDFVLHFSIYGVLSLLSFFGLTKFSFTSISSYNALLVCLTGIVLGFIIELIQENFIPGRQFEWSDVIFNSLGAMLVFLLNKLAPTAKL